MADYSGYDGYEDPNAYYYPDIVPPPVQPAAEPIARPDTVQGDLWKNIDTGAQMRQGINAANPNAQNQDLPYWEQNYLRAGSSLTAEQAIAALNKYLANGGDPTKAREFIGNNAYDWHRLGALDGHGGDNATGTVGGLMGLGGGGNRFAFPDFNAPTYDFSYGEFQAPTAEQAASEPGYAFARDEGLKAMERSAAARGLLRTGGTIKDLTKWGNQFAEQNYGNAYNRALNTYSTNRGNAFDSSRAIYDRNYTAAKDEFQPKFEAAKMTFEDNYRRWRDLLNTNSGLVTTGAGAAG